MTKEEINLTYFKSKDKIYIPLEEHIKLLESKQERIDKAIEYIEQVGSKTKVDDTMAVINFVREIKNILKGEDNE